LAISCGKIINIEDALPRHFVFIIFELAQPKNAKGQGLVCRDPRFGIDYQSLPCPFGGIAALGFVLVILIQFLFGGDCVCTNEYIM
jgi:hypothetical protein